jgi:cation-transporting P-type ATPase I
MDAEELASFSRRLRESVTRLPQVQWVEINPYTRRAVLAFEPDSITLAQLTELVEGAERPPSPSNGFAGEVREHPADIETAQRLSLELIADLFGFALGTTLKFSILRPSNLAASTAAIAAIVGGSPRLRRGIDERLGPERADLLMSLGSSLALGLAQRPMSSLVEIFHKTALLREAQARKGSWEAREALLCAEPVEHRLGDVRVDPRPVPLPRGPIEEYADRAWMVSLAGFAVSFVTTRSAQRAVAALFGGLPKPARLGRDVFAADLGRELSARGTLVLDPDALRRLDRVDCLVLQGDLVARDEFVVGEVLTDGSVAADEVRRIAEELFDPDAPIDVRGRSGWALGPAQRLGGALQPELAEGADRLARDGALVVGVAHHGRVVALAEVKLIPQTGVDELITAAHEAEMRVVIASNDESVVHGIAADDTIPEGDGMRGGIRRLQREGRVVCVVATGASPGLRTADVGVGLLRAGEATPWGAHVICKQDLSDVRFLIRAVVSARKIAKQSVNIALGAATVGALVTAGGLVPMSTRRVMAVVNVATVISMANGVRGSAALARRALPEPRDRTPWFALDARGVMSRLRTGERGLSRRDALQRRGRAEAPKPAILELGEAIGDELFNPLAPLLAAGAGLSAVVGSVADATMVGGVVALNAVVGGVQKFRTERAIRSLERASTRRARVVRGGETRELEAGELVRGDVVLLMPGDVVPADCRVVETESLEVDASSLTGESLPVRKSADPSFEPHVADRSSMVYEGTTIAAGHATAVVVAVGDETEARRASGSARRDPARSGVEQRLRSLINLTGPIALGAGVGLIGGGLFRGRRLADLVGSGVSLAVASVPEGLPLLATAAQLAAAERLLHRGALVRNVRSIEALGRVDVLCVDKTGTVTEGRIELSDISDGSEEDPIESLSGSRVHVLAAALRATPDLRQSGAQADPTDAALLRGAAKNALTPQYGHDGWRRRSELSFEAGRGYHAVVGDVEQGSLLSVKGAPETILPHCTRWRRGTQHAALDEAGVRELEQCAEQLARRGLRVLAVAERAVAAEDRVDPRRLVGLTFYGFVAFSDPVRPSAASALAQLKRAGVNAIMITGDHPSTGEAIARELDMLDGKGVLTGAELSRLDDDAFDARIKDISVYARVTPSQKVRIVRALQRSGRVVAMVGDGANDAPAIRLANVGIALGENCTSAARAAADVIVTDERIETLVDAIVEGRAMWASVRDAVSILVGGNLGEIGFTLAAGMVDGRPPLNARQLLLVNLLTDVAPAMAIALRPPSQATLDSLANEGPDVSLGQPLNRDIAARAAITAFGAGSAWLVGRFTGSAERASTIGLLALVGTQLGQTVVSGDFSRPVITTGVGSAAVLAAIVQTPGVSQFFGCRPLGPFGWATAIGASALATGVSVWIPEVAQKVKTRLRISDVLSALDPDQLPERRDG